MKIYYIYTALVTKGGADRVIAEKANWLAEHGQEVAIVTDTQMGREPVFPLSPKVRLIDLAIDFSKEYGHGFLMRIYMYYKLMHQYRKKMTEVLMHDRPDIVITTLGRDISFITKIKDGSIKIGEAHTTKHFIRNFHLLEQRNIIFRYLTKYFRWNMDREVSRLDALVVLTSQDQHDWGNKIPVYVIPNSYPFYPDIPSTCDNKQAIIVGRYNSAKGYNYLVDAWKLVHQKHPDWIINIYGSGEYENDICHRIIDEGLQEVIIMNPPTDHIMEEYLNSSIYVMSSVFEGFAMVLLEAMACGLPCVSFDCPYGPRNVITDGEDGILVEYLNFQALADNICRLIENKDLRKAMGNKGRRNVMRFSRETIMPQWVDLFESVIKTK
jgi:glycosyltransferase involved in cell wall biosynthesis